MHTPPRASPRKLVDAAGGLVGAVGLAAIAGVAVTRFWLPDPRLSVLLGYLAVWVPLGTAIVIASLVHGSRSFSRDFGLRFTGLDLLWGLSIGLLARAAAGGIELIFYGRMAQPQAGFEVAGFDVGANAWWLFTAAVAPVLIAPLIEELFFRGLLLRAVLERFGSAALAIVLSAVAFALMHVVLSPYGAGTAVIGIATLVLGLAAATLSVLTRRIGGAIIAHVTFNALVLVPALF